MNADGISRERTRASRRRAIAIAGRSGRYRDEARSLLRDLMLWQRILHDAGASHDQEELFYIALGKNGRPVLRMRPLDAPAAHVFVASLYTRFPRRVQADIAKSIAGEDQDITSGGEADGG